MSKIGVEAEIFIGVVSKIIGETEKERLEFLIEADIPGVIKGVKAFPRRDVLDEPKIGDQVVLMRLDPEQNSYYLYWKLKENEFTGFRACGKEFSITPDHILIEVYDKEKWEKPEQRTYNDWDEIENKNMEMIASIEMKNSGEIIMKNKEQTTVTLEENGDVNVRTKGHNMTVNLGGGTLTLANGTVVFRGGIIEESGVPPFMGDPAHLPEGPYVIRTNKIRVM